MTNKAAGHKNINDLNPEKKQWSHLIEFIIVEYRLMGSEAEVSNAHVEKTWIKSETKLWHKWSVGTSELVLAKCLKKGAKPLDAGLSPLLFWVEVACRALLRCACNGKHTCIKVGFLVVKKREWFCEEQVLCGCYCFARGKSWYLAFLSLVLLTRIALPFQTFLPPWNCQSTFVN